MIAANAQSSADALLYGLVLIVGIAVLGAVMYALRRCFVSRKDTKSESPFSLQHLRDLRAEGQITEAEFQQLKSRLLGAATGGESRKDGAPWNEPRSFDAQGNQIKEPMDRRR